MVRRLDTSMLDGEDTPGPRPTPLAHKVVDRILHKRERCEKHCQCVTTMRVKVSTLYYVFVLIAGYLIRSAIVDWYTVRALRSAQVVTSNAERMTTDRAAPRAAEDK